jgi:uncharacterized membrane protein
MPLLKTTLAILVLLLAGTWSPLAAKPQAGATTCRIVATDPGAGSIIATGDKLYLRISYESQVPVRFQIEAFRQALRQEDAFTSSTPPYNAGRGEALAWISFSAPLRVDEIRVTAFDMEWQELHHQTIQMVVIWEAVEAAAERSLAEWVGPMLKHHRQVFDQAYDPQPQKPETLFDLFFLFSFMAVPAYLFLQIKMLTRCPSGWRNYVIAPLLPIVPLCLYSLVGLGMETAYWIIFLFRYFPAALAYLLIVWGVKWFYDRRQRAAAPR